MGATKRWTFRPLTLAQWNDFVALFGPKGACAGCWCFYWRVPRPVYSAGCADGGRGNRIAMRKRVKKGPPPGLLAYDGKTPVGWITVAPREEFVRLGTSRTLKPVDDQPVWSAPCFFVAKSNRRRGLSRALLEAAAEFAKKSGAEILEGSPTETKKDQPAPFVYTGLKGAFDKAGFEVAARRSKVRPVMRKQLR